MPFELENICHAFSGHAVLDHVSLVIPEASITVILGPSGCGKTTFLNIVAGLVAADSGLRKGFEGTSFSYAFQEPRLLPWLDARQNMLFALSGLADARDAERRSDFFLDAAGLSDACHKRPAELSGGMRQRLSLARAFAYPSSFILLDEAFQAVDLRTKLGLMDSFLEMWKKEKRSAVIVTHDIHEAVYLADQVVVLTDRPASVADRFMNEEPRDSRSFGSEASLGMEARLYRLVLSPKGGRSRST
jgi:NitT/TauT family transport system ATP-binding protein